MVGSIQKKSSMTVGKKMIPMMGASNHPMKWLRTDMVCLIRSMREGFLSEERESAMVLGAVWG